MITLTAVPGTDSAAWHVSEDGATLGIWQRTEHGATFSDTAGQEVVTITAVGDGTAIVAGWGADRGQWSDIAHKILAGSCEMVSGDEPTLDERAQRLGWADNAEMTHQAHHARAFGCAYCSAAS